MVGKKVIVGITAFGVILGAFGWLTFSRGKSVGFLLRALRGISTIGVWNDSGIIVQNIEVVLGKNAVLVKKHLEKLAPGGMVFFPEETSDLCLLSLEYQFEGRKFRYNSGGIACPGEIFVVKILKGGSGVGIYK